MAERFTEEQMDYIEDHWCERCCNFDRSHVGVDGTAVCALTGTLAWCQEYGGDCIGFNRPAEQLKKLVRSDEFATETNDGRKTESWKDAMLRTFLGRGS